MCVVHLSLGAVRMALCRVLVAVWLLKACYKRFFFPLISSMSSSHPKAWKGLSSILFRSFGDTDPSKLLLSTPCMTVERVRVVFFQQ